MPTEGLAGVRMQLVDELWTRTPFASKPAHFSGPEKESSGSLHTAGHRPAEWRHDPESGYTLACLR